MAEHQPVFVPTGWCAGIDCLPPCSNCFASFELHVFPLCASQLSMQQDGVLQFLDAIEPPVRLTPRDRLERGLTHGSDWEGVKGLHSVAIASLADGDEALGIRCLLALAELCREVECSEHLGAVGGHQSILRLMTDGQLPGGGRRRKSDVAAGVAKQPDTDREPANNAVNSEIEVICGSDPVVTDDDDDEEDDVQSAAALAAARIVGSGCIFPMHASFPGESSGLGRFPLRYDFVVASNGGGNIAPPPSCSAVDAARSRSVGAHASQGQGTPNLGGGEGGQKEHISILVRPVKERQHSQFDVGFQMWPAAVILSRYLCRNPEVIRGRRVLEIGAGLGLCGLLAAHFATSVTLSDVNPVVLRALKGNVALNSGCTTSDHVGNERGEDCGETKVDGNVNDTLVRGTGVAIAEPGGVIVRHLDWDTLPAHAPKVGPLCPSSSGRQDADQAPKPTAVVCGADRGDVGIADSVGNGEGEDTEGIDHGDRFDVIIASDHICQVRHVVERFLRRQYNGYTISGTVHVKSRPSLMNEVCTTLS